MNFNIEKYIHGEMDDLELREFESAMQSNPDFKKEVERQILIIKDLRTSSLSQKIKVIQKKQLKQERRNLIIAIIALFIILLFVLLKTKNDKQIQRSNNENHSKKDSISEQNHENKDFNHIQEQLIHPDSLNLPNPYLEQKLKSLDTNYNHQKKLKLNFTTNGNSESKPKSNSDPTDPNPELLLAIALREYTIPDELSYLRSMDPDNVLDSIRYYLNVEKFDEGLRMLIRSGLNDNDMNFWAAHFHFKQGRYSSAIMQLKKIKINELSKEKIDRIDWYLFLCFLANGNPQSENLNIMFEKIERQTKHLYKKKIKIIMDEIDREKN